MQTNIGQVSWYDVDNGGDFLDCELELVDYNVNLFFADGTSIKITISDESFYLTEIDDGEYAKCVFIKKPSGTVVEAFTIETNKESKIGQINNHFNELNNSLTIRQEDFLQKVNNKTTHITMNNQEINQLVYNFLDRTDRFLFVDFKNLVCFERYLVFKFGLGVLTLQTNEVYSHLLTFNSIIDDFEEDVEIDNLTDYYEKSFLKLVKVISKKENFETSEEGIFVTWKSLLIKVCHYYYNLFNNEYGEYISDVELLSLHECIMAYIKIDLIDINSFNNASVFTYYLMYLGKFDGNQNYLNCNKILLDKLVEIIEEKELDDFETSLMETSTTSDYTIEEVDLMSGQEFENFVAHLFRKMGYASEVTKTSGDQGIDVIVEKNGKRIGIQTKCYSNTVSNKAIQEVVAGIKYYQLTKGIVITNNYFTESAKILAQSNEVVIWDRNILKEKISEVL